MKDAKNYYLDIVKIYNSLPNDKNIKSKVIKTSVFMFGLFILMIAPITIIFVNLFLQYIFDFNFVLISTIIIVFLVFGFYILGNLMYYNALSLSLTNDKLSLKKMFLGSLRVIGTWIFLLAVIILAVFMIFVYKKLY